MQPYIITPDYYNDYISHYGVKGMKWRKRKKKKMTAEQKNKYYAQKMADDVISGRRILDQPFDVIKKGKHDYKIRQGVVSGKYFKGTISTYTGKENGEIDRERQTNKSEFERAYGAATLRKKKTKK